MGCPSRGWHAATRSTGSSEADIAHAACRWAQPAYLLVQKRLLERHVPPCRVAADAAQVVSAAAGMKFWLQTGPHTPSGTWRTMSPTIWLAELPQVCAGGRQSAAAANLRAERERDSTLGWSVSPRQTVASVNRAREDEVYLAAARSLQFRPGLRPCCWEPARPFVSRPIEVRHRQPHPVRWPCANLAGAQGRSGAGDHFVEIRQLHRRWPVAERRLHKIGCHLHTGP